MHVRVIDRRTAAWLDLLNRVCSRRGAQREVATLLVAKHAFFFLLASLDRGARAFEVVSFHWDITQTSRSDPPNIAVTQCTFATT